MTQNYQEALSFTKNYLNEIQVTDWNYNGVVDVCDIFNFQELGDTFDLTENEYEKLIDKTQELATKKLNSFDVKTGKEKTI